MKAPESSAWAANLLQDRAAFGQAIKAARQAKGWTQSQLGHTMGVSVFAVSRWEHGKGLKVPQVMLLAQVLDLPGAAPPTGTPHAQALDRFNLLADLTQGQGPVWDYVERTLIEAEAQIRRAIQTAPPPPPGARPTRPAPTR